MIQMIEAGKGGCKETMCLAQYPVMIRYDSPVVHASTCIKTFATRNCSDSVHAHQAAVVCNRANMSGLFLTYAVE